MGGKAWTLHVTNHLGTTWHYLGSVNTICIGTQCSIYMVTVWQLSSGHSMLYLHGHKVNYLNGHCVLLYVLFIWVRHGLFIWTLHALFIYVLYNKSGQIHPLLQGLLSFKYIFRYNKWVFPTVYFLFHTPALESVLILYKWRRYICTFCTISACRVMLNFG